MHVCFLAIGYHSAQSGGGIESYISTLAEEMKKSGHYVTIIALSSRNAIQEDAAGQILEVVAPNLHWYLFRGLPAAKSLAMPVREIEWSRRLWETLLQVHAKRPVDVVESPELGIFWRSFLPASPPLVVRGHGNDYALRKFSGQRVGFGHWLARRMELRGFRHAAAISAVSHFQARELSKDMRGSDKPVRVIPNPIGTLVLREAEKGSGCPRCNKNSMILYTGRIEYRKGVIPLLRSIPAVTKVCPDVQFVLAGARHNSIDDRRLEQELSHGGIRSNLKMIGHVPWEDLAEWYRKATVFVMPSYYETFGISVIEAMAFGLPVVATTAGGLPEVVENGVTGILMPPGDDRALSDAVLRLLKDPDMRYRMGQAGRDRVRELYTVERVCGQTLNLYKEVLESRI